MLNQKEREGIRHAVRRRPTKKPFLVASECVQGWDVCGYDDLGTAWEHACSLAEVAPTWGYASVYLFEMWGDPRVSANADTSVIH